MYSQERAVLLECFRMKLNGWRILCKEISSPKSNLTDLKKKDVKLSFTRIKMLVTREFREGDRRTTPVIISMCVTPWEQHESNSSLKFI